MYYYLHDFLPRKDNRAAGGVVYYRQLKIILFRNRIKYTADDLYVITITIIIVIPYEYDEVCPIYMQRLL